MTCRLGEQGCHFWSKVAYRGGGAGGLISGEGGVGLFPNHRLRIVGLGVVYGLGMAVAKHDDPIAFVASHEAAVTDLWLTKGVHGSTGRQEVAFVRQASLRKEGGFGRFLNPVQVEDAGRGIGLLKLGIDTVGKIGAVNFCRGVFGTLEKEKTALFVKGGGVRAIIAGGHETGHGRKDVVPGVGLLAKLAETLEPFPTFLRKVAVVLCRISDGKRAELLELAGGFGFTGGGQTALNRRDTESSQKPDDGHDDQELDEGKSVLL